MKTVKTTLVTLTAVAVAAGAFAQGQVAFRNMLRGVPTPFIYLWETGGLIKVPASSGTNFQAYAVDLYYGPAGTSNPNSLTPMGLTTYFSPVALQAGLFNAPTAIAIPNTYGGEVVTLQIRSWETKGGLYTSYAAALAGAQSVGGVFIGEGNPVQVTLGAPPMPPPDMVGIDPIIMRDRLPEPTAAAIAGLGLAVMLILRRNRSAKGLES